MSGGENIYPAEVENVLMSHPAIADVAVIGVPSEKWGEIARRRSSCSSRTPTPTTTAIIAFARRRLATYKCPTSVDFIDALPRNPSGKILKKDFAPRTGRVGPGRSTDHRYVGRPWVSAGVCC